MQHFKALRTRTKFVRTKFAISSILGLCFALVSFGCSTGENQVADADFGLAAKAVPEGILVTFSNIPSDTTHLWIYVNTLGYTEESGDFFAIIDPSYACIIDASVQGWRGTNSTRQLEKVKQTKKVIFPIVQAGQNYQISATIYNQQGLELMRNNDERFLEHIKTAETECIAENGIYFDKDFVKLELNDANSAVTISSEPLFSSEVTFAANKYSYGITINEGLWFADQHIPDTISPDGLTWTFEPQMAEDLKEGNYLENGSYAAYAEATVNIIYDDIMWSVEIAKTPEFIYSL